MGMEQRPIIQRGIALLRVLNLCQYGLEDHEANPSEQTCVDCVHDHSFSERRGSGWRRDWAPMAGIRLFDAVSVLGLLKSSSCWKRP